MVLNSIGLCLQFFNNALMLGKSSESEVSGSLYDVIYELNQISPSVLLAVLPQLEFKLKVQMMISVSTSNYSLILTFKVCKISL